MKDIHQSKVIHQSHTHTVCLYCHDMNKSRGHVISQLKHVEHECVSLLLDMHPPPIQSTPLHLAAGYNRVGVVEVLIKHGADVHAKDKGGLVPLHNACSYGHYEVAELLVKVGILCSLA